MVTHFNALDLVDEESLPDHEHASWHSHKYFWQPPIVNKLLACPLLDDIIMDANTVIEEEIIFVTAADDDLEFTSDDEIFLEDELCVPFNRHLFPHHDKGTIQDVLQASTLLLYF